MVKMLKWLSWLLAAAMTPALAQQNRSAISFGDIEEAIQRIESAHADEFEGGLLSMIHKLDRALKSDSLLIKFYIGAYWNVRFGTGEKSAKKVAAWKAKNAALLASKDFKQALRLHIMFIQSTLWKKLGNDEKAMEICRAIFEKAAGKIDLYRKYDLFRRGLKDSPILNMGARSSLLRGIKGWYVRRLSSLGTMHRINVIGVLRTRNDTTIIDEWRKDIQFEKVMAKKSTNPNAMVRFEKEMLPSLQWNMASDYVRLGEYRKGMDLLVTALESNPTHPEYARMLADLKKWLVEAKKVKVRK